MKSKMIIALVALFICIFGVAYAANSGEGTNDDVITIDNLDDLGLILNQTDTAESEEDTAGKEYFEQYQNYIKEYYASYERPTLTKAKVIEAGNSKFKYDTSSYYSVSRYYVQKVKLELLEGEFKGKEVDAEYMRTGDSMDNLHFAPLKVGDTVFVNAQVDDNGNVSVSFANAWSSVSRSSVIYILAIIGILLLIIYAGRKGLNASLIVISIGLFCFIILTNFAFHGLGILNVGIPFIFLLIASIALAHFGRKKIALKAMMVSAIVTAICFVLLWFVSFISRTVGVTFEIAAISESLVLNPINYQALFNIITLVISSAFITNTVCLAVKKMERESAQNFEERIELCKDILLSNIVMLAAALFALYIPNHLLLLSNKFNEIEILNSEVFVVEIVRFLAIAISMILAVPLLSLEKLGIGRKYLAESKDKDVDVEK